MNEEPQSQHQPPLGTIAIEGIEIFGYHGVYAEEQEQGTHFEVDVYLRAPIQAAAHADERSHTVDYQAVYQLVLDIMGERMDLLETLAVQIGEEILRRFSAVAPAEVRVAKLRPLGMSQCRRTYVALQFDRFP